MSREGFTVYKELSLFDVKKYRIPFDGTNEDDDMGNTLNLYISQRTTNATITSHCIP